MSQLLEESVESEIWKFAHEAFALECRLWGYQYKHNYDKSVDSCKKGDIYIYIFQIYEM